MEVPFSTLKAHIREAERIGAEALNNKDGRDACGWQQKENRCLALNRQRFGFCKEVNRCPPSGQPETLCGRRGIQTPDTRKGYTGFRVQRIRSLCHSSFSWCKSNSFFRTAKTFCYFYLLHRFRYGQYWHESASEVRAKGTLGLNISVRTRVRFSRNSSSQSAMSSIGVLLRSLLKRSM